MKQSKLTNLKDIESFLKIGYFLNYNNPSLSFDFSQIDKEKYIGLSFEELIELGISIFMKAIQTRFSNNEKHVIPLSGGLDSRAVLAALLEFTNASNIHTYTFGTPGTLDYDIGYQVADIIGTNHISLPLNNYRYSMDELIDISHRINHQTVLFHHPPIWLLDELYKDYTFWSGFLGGELTDARFIEKEDSELKVVKRNFITDNKYQNEVFFTNSADENIFDQLTHSYNEDLTNYEVIEYNNRQLKFIAPHLLIDGFNYQLPFMDQNVINF